MKNKRKRNDVTKASFTIEASFVVPITLFVLVAMILAGYKVHDIFFTNLSANEASEIYSHLPTDGAEDAQSVSESENDKLKLLFSEKKYTLSLEGDEEGGSVSTITGDGEERTYELKAFRPEKTLRTVTIVEEIISDE